MSTPLRRIGIVVLAMFCALYISASWLQVVAAEDIADDDRNVRKLYESFSAERGEIVAGGIPILLGFVVDLGHPPDPAVLSGETVVLRLITMCARARSLYSLW